MHVVVEPLEGGSQKVAQRFVMSSNQYIRQVFVTKCSNKFRNGPNIRDDPSRIQDLQTIIFLAEEEHLLKNQRATGWRSGPSLSPPDP